MNKEMACLYQKNNVNLLYLCPTKISPMKSKSEETPKSFEKDYEKIMKGFKIQNSPLPNIPQWANPGDFIIKFSLYQETPNSITSTDTAVYLGA